MMGVGGSFDVLSGQVNRAPELFIRLNLEWFYRLITQPTRAKRMLKIPQFLLAIQREKREKNGTRTVTGLFWFFNLSRVLGT